MCHGYWSRHWERRFEEEEQPREEPVTFVRDPEEPAEEEPREPDREVVLTGAND